MDTGFRSGAQLTLEVLTDRLTKGLGEVLLVHTVAVPVLCFLKDPPIKGDPAQFAVKGKDGYSR